MKLDIEDLYRMKLVGDVQVSPNGTIAFVMARMNRKKDEYLSWIYIYDGKLKRFTTTGKDTMPRFTEDGESLVFFRRKDKGGEIRVMSLKGGESETLVTLENGVSDLKVERNYVYYLHSVMEKGKDDVKRIESLPFYFNGKGFIYNAEMQISRVSLKGGKSEKMVKERRIGSFDVREEKIVFSVNENEKEPFMEHLYLWEEGKKKRLTEREASINAFGISPDGKKIAVFLKFNEKGFAEDSSLYMLPIEGGEYERACEDKFSFGKSLNSDARFGSSRVMQWINDEDILFIITESGRQPIYLYSKGKCWKFLDGERSIETFHYSSGTLAFVAQEMNRPGEVFVKGGREKRITNFNRRFSTLPRAENFKFRASDGVEVEGWILLPEGKKPYPAVLEIHGGPKTSYGHAFMFEFYYLLSQGFAVIFTNPRGSSGYGEEFALRIRGAFGDRDYKDIIEAVDFVLENYPIDEKRLFVTGGSYGGFMTNWIVGHTSRFKAAVTQRSISNQLSFWGTSDIGPWFNKDYIGAGKDLWDGFDKYWNMSPLKYAKNIRTPLLIIHSEEDYRCPVSEAYQLFYALKMNDIPTKLVLFPKENHDLSRSGKPRHREARLREIAEWFKKYLE